MLSSKMRYITEINSEQVSTEPCSVNCSSSEPVAPTYSLSQNGNLTINDTVTTDTQPVNNITAQQSSNPIVNSSDAEAKGNIDTLT
jgi:hypothetical protein